MKKICKAVFALIPAVLIFTAAAFAGEPGDSLFFPQGGRLHVLDLVGPGERYEEPGDPSTVFVSEGREARLTIGGRAVARYVITRDTGEDEFILTVDGANFLMRQAISASGAKYEAADDPETVFWSKGDKVTLTVRGEDYPEYDIWQFSGAVWLTGEAFPAGIEWRVKSAGGVDAQDGSPVSVTFLGDGTLHGAAVNSFRSSWLASGGRLVITPPAATMMMGPPERMELESALLEALPMVIGFRLRVDGITLLTRDGPEIELTL
ncbi:MAG: META domain-containing protein [Synergistaceae bacterium]|jgi:heat shock protein HslJ|nr:META domain-containing protein [Synergistaceae bacterium]